MWCSQSEDTIQSWKWLAAQEREDVGIFWGNVGRVTGRSSSANLHGCFIKCFWYFFNSSGWILYTQRVFERLWCHPIPELRTYHPYYLFLTSLLTIQETYIFLGLRNIRYHITPAENVKVCFVLCDFHECLLCLDRLDMLYLPAVDVLRSLDPSGKLQGIFGWNIFKGHG